MPLHLGSPAAFQKVRDFLRATGYTEDFLLDHFRLPALHNFLNPVGAVREYLERTYQGPGTPLLLARLFLGGYSVPESEIAANIPADIVESMLELRLLRDGREPEQLQSHGILYPIGGLYVASDMSGRIPGLGYSGKDFCMTGIEDICRDFLDSFPKTPCKRLLDMGTGSGLAALAGSLTAAESIGVDITERAVRYSEFNRLLNGRPNLKYLQGDLFAPVEGLTFDRIVSNPPFEAPLKQGMIYSVGGEDGEAIVARLIAECPKYLDPGGRVYVSLAATDREGESLEQRVVRWLGASAQEFDIALFPHSEFEPEAYAREQVLGHNFDSWKIVEYQMFYSKYKVHQIAVGQLILERHASKREPMVIRRKAGPMTTVREMEWLFDWERRSRDPRVREEIMRSPLNFGKDWELVVRHSVKDNRMAAQQYTFKTEYPFEVELSVAAWVAMVVAQCNGSDTGDSMYEALSAKAPVSREHYLGTLSALIGMGVVRVDGVDVPEAMDPPAFRKGF